MIKSRSFEKMNNNKSLLKPTPINRSLAIKTDGFTSLVDALEYAAQGDSGFNFYDHRGELKSVLSYRDLRQQARELATRLIGLGGKHGDRVGIVAETDPMFHRFFFACLYAGLIPVALPASVQMGARKAYVGQISRMLKTSGATIAVAGSSYASFLQEASEGLDLLMSGTPDDFDSLPLSEALVIVSVQTEHRQKTNGSSVFARK